MEERLLRARVDHYRVLGLRPTASREEIRRAYRRMARRVHPDTHPEWKDDSKWLMPVDDPHTLYHLLRERAAATKHDLSRPTWWAVVVHARELVVTVVVVFGTVVAALLWGTSPGG